MEKLKDFIHDTGDTFISILIVVAIIGVVSWKITGTMGIDNFANKVVVTKTPVVEQAIINKPGIEIVEDDVIELPDVEQTPAATVITEVDDVVTPIETVLPVSDTVVSSTDTVKEFEVVIKPGSIASIIADTLKEEGVISDTGEFIERLKYLGLEQKLQSGDYTFKSDMTLTEIIKKLAHIKS